MASAVSIEQLSVNTIRTLSMDAVQAANSGHPGTPMALAPVVYTLRQRFLRFDPADPIWPDRDRFILSVGHASMLLYSMLHLTGVKSVNPKYEVLGEPAVTLDDIRRFRQLDSKCPGHPEYRWTSGVETATGPLGQGVATSVGIAMAKRWMAEHFNRPGFDLFTYDVYALCGDGDLMEGGSFARLVPSDSLHDPDLPAKPALSALVAVAGPADSKRWGLDPVDVAAEADRALTALGDIQSDVLAGDHPRSRGLTTLANLLDRRLPHAT